LVNPFGAQAATWTVGHSGDVDFTGLYEACMAAAAGDSILINPGYYDESEWWNRIGAKPLNIIGLGASPDNTALKVRLGIEDCSGFLFENLCIRDGEVTPVFCYASNVTFRNCAVRDNHEPAIREVIRGDLLVEDCTFSGNFTREDRGTGAALWGRFTVRRCLFVDNMATEEGGAVKAENGSTIEDCVFFRNEAPMGAALAFATDVGVHNCTFLANRVTGPNGGAIAVLDATYDKPISHCIIAGTVNGYGVACPGSGSMECCDLWDNDSGNMWSWWCDALGSRGNIFVDPMLCDVATGDVGLLPGSPCLPGNHGGEDCGLIGAQGIGCGIVATRPTTWGQLKLGFR
jgi:hypothetical protein